MPCAITGQPVAPSIAHVDHASPSTFRALIDLFLAGEGLDYGALGVKPTTDASTVMELADAALAAKWRAFHQTHAILRITWDKANLSRGSRGSR